MARAEHLMSSLPSPLHNRRMVAPQNTARSDWALRLYHTKIFVSLPSEIKRFEHEVPRGRASSDGLVTEVRNFDMELNEHG